MKRSRSGSLHTGSLCGNGNRRLAASRPCGRSVGLGDQKVGTAWRRHRGSVEGQEYPIAVRSVLGQGGGAWRAGVHASASRQRHDPEPPIAGEGRPGQHHRKSIETTVFLPPHFEGTLDRFPGSRSARRMRAGTAVAHGRSDALCGRGGGADCKALKKSPVSTSGVSS